MMSRPPQPAEAIKALTAAMEIAPEDPEVAFNLAAVLESSECCCCCKAGERILPLPVLAGGRNHVGSGIGMRRYPESSGHRWSFQPQTVASTVRCSSHCTRIPELTIKPTLSRLLSPSTARPRPVALSAPPPTFATSVPRSWPSRCARRRPTISKRCLEPIPLGTHSSLARTPRAAHPPSVLSPQPISSTRENLKSGKSHARATTKPVAPRYAHWRLPIYPTTIWS